MRTRPITVLICLFTALAAVAVAFPPQEVRYGTGSWDSETLGNHRAVLQVSEQAEAVWAHIPWRRRDAEPEKKNVIVVEERTGGRVSNVLPLDVKQSYGDILFQAPNAGTNSPSR